MEGIHSVIIDTGPLVALLNRREKYHDWMLQQLELVISPWIICEAVLSEAWFLVRHRPEMQDQLLEIVEEGAITTPFSIVNEIEALRDLRRKYRDVPMSLADACLVRMSEIIPQSAVLTFDSDFLVYRRPSNKPISLISPAL